MAQHIILTTGGFSEMLSEPIRETSRPAHEMARKIKTDFLNFNIMMDSPVLFVWWKKDYHKAELMEILTAQEKTLQFQQKV